MESKYYPLPVPKVIISGSGIGQNTLIEKMNYEYAKSEICDRDMQFETWSYVSGWNSWT